MSVLSPQSKTEARPYGPQGKHIDLMLCQEEMVLLDGGVGTGKSRAALEKMYLAAKRYPESRHLILRKTRKSCTDTCLVTFEDEVVPRGDPLVKGPARQNRHSYILGNGSEIVVAGMDDPTKIMSSQWDRVFINESIELFPEDVEALTTRMRNGKTPYHQIILDTNPGPPSHWLWKYYQEGRIHRIPSTLMDNPRFFDAKKNAYTEEGQRYVDNLSKVLTGSRLERLLKGIWSIAEGARFPQCDPNEHLFDAHVLWPHGMPGNMTRWISIDHGLRNPYCALWHAADKEGNVYTYREDYGPDYTADVQAERVLQLSPEDADFYAIYLDPSMWAQTMHATARPASKRLEEKCAADYYRDVLGRDKRFGPVVPGVKDPEKGFPTLDALLNRGNDFPNWYIERGCQNLWDELLGAVFWRTPQGIWTEQLDPKCADHAITSATYGLHTHYHRPQEKRDDMPTLEELAEARMRRRRKLSEQNFDRTFPTRKRNRY